MTEAYYDSITLSSDENEERFFSPVELYCDETGEFFIDDGYNITCLSMGQAAGLHREIGQMLIRYNRHLLNDNPPNNTPKEAA